MRGVVVCVWSMPSIFHQVVHPDFDGETVLHIVRTWLISLVGDQYEHTLCTYDRLSDSA